MPICDNGSVVQWTFKLLTDILWPLECISKFYYHLKAMIRRIHLLRRIENEFNGPKRMVRIIENDIKTEVSIYR